MTPPGLLVISSGMGANWSSTAQHSHPPYPPVV